MESNLDNDKERIAVLETKFEDLNKTLTDIQTKVNSLHDTINKYHGFVGALTFIGSGFVIAVGLLKDYIVNHWK